MSDLSVTVRPELVDLLSERVADAIVKRLDEARSTESTYFDVAAAARYLACEDHRIYDLVSQRRLRVAREGRRLLFRRQWLDECLSDDSTAS